MHDNITTFFALMLVSFVVGMFGRLIKIPYTIALVFAGLFIGSMHWIPEARLSPEVLFAIFLPPLLFEGGINIKLSYLRAKWRLVLALAVFGTIISMFAVGSVACWLFGLPLAVALLFGAIISPTDPISVLAIFRKSGMNEKLTMVIEAESLFNDGVAVVLFVVIQQIIATAAYSLPGSMWLFLKGVCGGLVLGTGGGFVIAALMSRTRDHLLCTTLTTLAAFGTYMAAEYIGVSGVIAVVAASLVIGNYGISKRLSGSACIAVLSFWEYAAFAVNSIVFLLIGIEITQVLHPAQWYLVLVGAVTVIFGRALSVYAISALFWLLGRRVPAKWQHMLVWSGLRGALSMAMVMGIAYDFPWRDTLLVFTFGVVLFSLIVQGLSIEPLIKLLKLEKNVKEQADGK